MFRFTINWRSKKCLDQELLLLLYWVSWKSWTWLSFVYQIKTKIVFIAMSCALIIAGQNTKRETGRKVQKENIQAGKVSGLKSNNSWSWNSFYGLFSSRHTHVHLYCEYCENSLKIVESYKLNVFKIWFLFSLCVLLTKII